MTAGDWEAFYAAQLGAAATLGGLVFVGLSLNLKTILTYAWLPSRALLALSVLVAILLVSSLMLIPGQTLATLGWGIAAIGLMFFVAGTVIEVYALRNVTPQNRNAFILNLILLELGVVPYIVGGVLIAQGEGSGFYWVAAGVIVSFVKAVLDAWVLLVEINR